MHCVCHITLGHIFHKICELEYLMEIIEILMQEKKFQFLTGKTDRKSGSRKKITHGLTAERYWQSSLAQFRMSITRIYLPIWRHFFSINGKVIWVLMFYSLWEFWPTYEHSHLCIYINMHLKLNLCSTKPITKPGLTSRIFSTMEWLWFGWTVSK